MVCTTACFDFSIVEKKLPDNQLVEEIRWKHRCFDVEKLL
jgi:hypothetical protein